MPELITFGESMGAMAPGERGLLRYCDSFKLRLAGAESNTAIGLCKLGHTAGWVGAVGNDGVGDFVLAAMRAEGVDTTAVKTDPHHRTGLLLKELSAGETSVYYYRENSAASHFSAKDIPYAYLRDAKILHISGITPVLSESCRGAVEAMIAFAGENGISVSFDPNIRRKLWGETDFAPMMRSMLFSAQIALLGTEEAAQILGTENPEEIVQILREKGVERIAVKNGGEGAWCADRETFVHIPPENCKSIDPVGAGDGFNAGFLCGVLEGKDIVTCGRMGAIGGAMATESTGDYEGYPSRSQMEIRLGNGTRIYR